MEPVYPRENHPRYPIEFILFIFARIILYDQQLFLAKCRTTYQIFCYGHNYEIPYTECPQEERSIFWEVTVSVILRKKNCICTCVLFRKVSEIDLFHCTVEQDAMCGRAIAQAVSRRLPIAAARVQTRVWSCGILWWTKVGLGQVFSENFGFPCQSTFHLLLHNHLHYHPRLVQ
jgi:hypothetical protein